MAEHTITIRNCNNIRTADISLAECTLNIKFGYNGTGKSTISEAIRLKMEGKDLSGLTPFWATDSENDNAPSVGDIPFRKVKVFNDEYIRQYLFKQEGIFADSYSVLLKSEECDELTRQINELLSELQDSVFQGDSIRTLAETLATYTSTVKYSTDGVTKRGGVGEVLKGGGAGFEKYPVLDRYKPFYSSTADKVAKWAKWRTDGISQMNGNACPFCTTDLEEDTIQAENATIKTVFKKSALDTAGAILKFLRDCIEKGYILQESQSVLETYLGDETKEQELYSELGHLGEETYYLHEKLQLIMSFRPMIVTNEELQKLEERLKQMQIEERQISKFYATDATKALVTEINGKINVLLSNTDRLKSLFFRHGAKLKGLINKRRDDINSFFTLAGFPYEFEIIEEGENKANTYLKPVGQTKAISNPQSHLSWGERNAFSLVMFMFDAVNENADLIVLDDPISSFDANKKFAVIRRMFDNQQEVTFRDRTVLMLTHDLQPIIDYIHGGFFKRYGLTTSVSAEYLENNKGEISSRRIVDSDLLNIVKLTETFAKEINKPLYVRVVNARKHIELTKENFSSMESYDILSNLIHGRETPEDGTKQPMTEDAIQKGIEDLKLYMSGYGSYSKLLQGVSTQYLLGELGNDNLYYRILVIRLLFERAEGYMTMLRREHPEACKFLNETNHIENDYVFQLNPEKFYSIPEVYVQEISDFINSHKDGLMAIGREQIGLERTDVE